MGTALWALLSAATEHEQSRELTFSHLNLRRTLPVEPPPPLARQEFGRELRSTTSAFQDAPLPPDVAFMRPLGTALRAPLNPASADPGPRAAGVLHTSADAMDQAGAPASVESRQCDATSSVAPSSRGLSSALSSVRSSSRAPSSARSFRGFSGGAAGVVTLTPPQVRRIGLNLPVRKRLHPGRADTHAAAPLQRADSVHGWWYLASPTPELRHPSSAHSQFSDCVAPQVAASPAVSAASAIGATGVGGAVGPHLPAVPTLQHGGRGAQHRRTRDPPPALSTVPEVLHCAGVQQKLFSSPLQTSADLAPDTAEAPPPWCQLRTSVLMCIFAANSRSRKRHVSVRPSVLIAACRC